MAFKKDNKCCICSLYYPVHVFDFAKNQCVFCAKDNPGRPTCCKCKKPFSEENVAVREIIDGEERIIHEKGCP